MRSRFSRLAPIRRYFGTISPDKIRNVAIIAHVDHGKTTLVDKLLRETNAVSEKQASDRVMDSGDLERERGITILSKCTSMFYKDYQINLVDTPGHSDFGGEVERILKMVDGVLLVVDVAEGPMAQTKFVLTKSLKKNLKSVLVLNKVDRSEERVEDAEIEVLGLYEDLNAKGEQLEYPVCYSSSKNGWAVKNIDDKRENMKPLLETIIESIPPPKVNPKDPFKFLVSMISYDKHLGRILTGRVSSGSIKPNESLKVIDLHGDEVEKGKVLRIMANRGIIRKQIDTANAGDIVSICGFKKATVANTVCDSEITEPISADEVDPPTLEVRVSVNTSPLQGRDGKKLTSTQIGDRLLEEAKTNIAIRVNALPDGISYSLEGRGELQLGVLIETMRREGYEMEVSPPKVLMKKDENGKNVEPYENVIIEVDDKFSGLIIEKMANKKAELREIENLESSGKTKLSFYSPSRSLIGFDSDLKNISRGTGMMNREFVGYGEYKGLIRSLRKASLVSCNLGKTTVYSLASVETKGSLFVTSNVEVYPGMIVGEAKTDREIEVNAVRPKRLTNIRAAGSEESIRLNPINKMSLEEAISYITEDELVEVTPNAIRLRKKILDSNLRKKARRQLKGMK